MIVRLPFLPAAMPGRSVVATRKRTRARKEALLLLRQTPLPPPMEVRTAQIPSRTNLPRLRRSSSGERRRRKKKSKKDKRDKKDKKADKEDIDAPRVDTKEATVIQLPAFPTIVQLPQRKTNFYHVVCSASGRKKDSVMLNWLMEVEDPKCKISDLAEEDKYPTLDRKLSTGFSKIFSGTIARKTKTYEKKLLRTEKRLVTGREM
jgi:hypothetical protein